MLTVFHIVMLLSDTAIKDRGLGYQFPVLVVGEIPAIAVYILGCGNGIRPSWYDGVPSSSLGPRPIAGIGRRRFFLFQKGGSAMKRRLCVFSVVFALLCSLALPSFADTNDDVGSGSSLVSDPVYSLSADSSLYDVAADIGISPLAEVVTNATRYQVAFTNTPSGRWFVAYKVDAIDPHFTAVKSTINDNLQETFEWLMYHDEKIVALESSLSDISKGLGFPEGKTFYDGPYRYFSNEGSQLTTDFLGYLYILQRDWALSPGVQTLIGDGTIASLPVGSSSPRNWIRLSFNGLAYILRGNSGSAVSGSLLNYSDLSETAFSADNLLSMLSPLLNVQNDVARLAHVVADPLDQALSDANKDNREEVVNSFGSGDAAVNPSDIGDMAGVSGSLSGNLDTGVSVGQAFDQMNDSSRFAFFSQECQDALNPFHSARVLSRSGDEDFVHFYDPDNSEFWALIGGDE